MKRVLIEDVTSEASDEPAAQTCSPFGILAVRTLPGGYSNIKKTSSLLMDILSCKV